MVEGLTDRQRQILEFIAEAVAERGYPPSVREIGEAVKLRSTSSVSHQLMALERLGVLYRDPHRPRAYRVRHRWTAEDGPGTAEPSSPTEAAQVPLVGRIAAGTPVLAEEALVR